MQESFNPRASINNGTPDMRNVKFCVALNYIFEVEPLQSKDSGKLFDSYINHSIEDVTPGLLGRVVGDPDKTPINKITRNGSLTNEVFAVSLVDQLEGAFVRKALWDLAPVFDGAIAFSIDEREIQAVKDQFPAHHGTLKAFDTAKERKNYLDSVSFNCIRLSQVSDTSHLHLDG